MEAAPLNGGGAVGVTGVEVLAGAEGMPAEADGVQT